MRISLFSALAVISFGLVAAQPAAASTYWTCMGPEVACGSAGSPSGSSYNYRSRERVYAGDSERRASTYRAKERYAAERPERRKAPVRVASVNPRSEEHVTADAAPVPMQKKVAAAAELPQEPKAAAEASSIATKVAASRPTQSGMASYYGTESGSQTASGARFVPSAMTAAHRTLPFGTKVLVTNKSNGRSVVVTINDRGPFVGGRIIDLSTGAAGAIGMLGAGVAPVSLEVLGKG
jgi:rare lipoprotein A (peptidoglycan hydrolase)